MQRKRTMITLDLITKEELEQFKTELFAELRNLGIGSASEQPAKKWLKSSEVRKLYCERNGSAIEASVANPPFSAHWSASNLFMNEDCFSQYGKLAPSSKADFAFIQYMIYHLAENGTMAVVMPMAFCSEELWKVQYGNF